MIVANYLCNEIYRSGWVTLRSHRGSWLLHKCVCAKASTSQIMHLCTSLQITNSLFILRMTHLHGAHSKLAPHLRSQRKRKTPGTTKRRGRAALPLRGARWSCSWRCSLGRGGLLRTENKRRSQKVSWRVLYHVTRTTVCSHSLSQLQRSCRKCWLKWVCGQNWVFIDFTYELTKASTLWVFQIEY